MVRQRSRVTALASSGGATITSRKTKLGVQQTKKPVGASTHRALKSARPGLASMRKALAGGFSERQFHGNMTSKSRGGALGASGTVGDDSAVFGMSRQPPLALIENHSGNLQDSKPGASVRAAQPASALQTGATEVNSANHHYAVGVELPDIAFATDGIINVHESN